MSDTGRGRPAWMRPADRSLLCFLASDGPEYPAIAANRTGVHATYAERRFEALAARGLVEPVSEEVVYRVTDEGRQYL